MKTNAKGIVAAAIAAALTAGSLAGTALANPIITIEDAGGVTEVVKSDAPTCVLSPVKSGEYVRIADGAGYVLFPPKGVAAVGDIKKI